MNSSLRNPCVLTLTILFLLAAEAFAGTVRTSWIGGDGTNKTWQDAANWAPSTPAYATDDTLPFDNASITINSALVVTGSGVVTIGPNGTIDVGSTGDLRLQGNATLNIQGTLIRAGSSNWFRFGDGGSLDATINHSGTLQSSSPIEIAFNQFSGSGQTAYNMTGGVLNGPLMEIGWSYASNTGQMIGIFNQSGSADVNIGGDVRLGQASPGHTGLNTGIGYYNMAGGTLDAAAIKLGYWLDNSTSGGSSIGVFTQTGGTIGGTARPNVLIAVGPSSGAANPNPTTGTYVMRGGTLRANSLTDNGTGASSTLDIQGGLGTIDVSGAFSFTAPSGSSVIADVGSTGLTTINVSGSGTANLGTATDLVGRVFGGAALSPNNTFTVLQLASGSITGAFVDRAAPLFTLSATSSQVGLALAPGAEKPQLFIGQSVAGLNDAFGWIDAAKGGYSLGTFGLSLHLAGDPGSGSVTDLADWMNQSGAGLTVTADVAANSITLHDLPTPSGAQSYFMWDLRQYNALRNAGFVVTDVLTIPEPSGMILAGIALAGLGAWARRRRSAPAG